MALLSPIKIDTYNKAILSYERSMDILDNHTKVTLSKKMEMLVIGKKSVNQGKSFEIEVVDFAPSNHQISIYFSMQGIIKSCADNAEYIKDRLLSLNLTLFGAKPEDRPEILKSDFMKLKDRFMDYLKTDSLIKTREEYNSTQKLKQVRRNFNQFVLDRNIYTHGLLHFLSPNYDFVIEYIDHAAKSQAVAYINTDMLISYNNFYNQANHLLDTFQETRRTK